MDSTLSSRTSRVVALSLYTPDSADMIRDQQPALAVVFPSSLALIVGKTSLLALSRRMNTVRDTLDDMEERDDPSLDDLEVSEIFDPRLAKTNPNLNIWLDFVPNVTVGVSRDVSTGLLQRTVEHALVKFANPSVPRAMIKNPSKSAVRKAERYPNDDVTVAYKVFLSTLKSQCLFWVSSFVVVSVMEIVLHKPSQQAASRYKSNAMSRLAYKLNLQSLSVALSDKHLPRRILLNGVRSMLGCVFSALGASIGTIAMGPGRGTFLGVLIAPSLGLNVATPFLN